LRSPVALRTTRRLGDRTDDVLEGGADSATPTQVLCECEGVTRAEVRDVFSQQGGDLQAVRKRTRATMGTCQGGICAPRLAIEMFRATDRDTAGATLRDLLEERWRGQRAIVEDDQLVQTMENLLRWTNALAVRQLWQSAAGIPFDRFDQGGAGKP
ncbi:MAG: (2Fe-2S)-binding protein, partial [Halanaeroarchaeum sp.]